MNSRRKPLRREGGGKRPTEEGGLVRGPTMSGARSGGLSPELTANVGGT